MENNMTGDKDNNGNGSGQASGNNNITSHNTKED